jgi:hypothetical protein
MIFAFTLLTATAWAANPLAACNSAKKNLVAYVVKLPSSCVADAECAAYYLGADSCDPAFILRKDTSVNADAGIKAWQDKVGIACAPIFAKRAVCAPKLATPGCRMGRCVDLHLGKTRQ